LKWRTKKGGGRKGESINILNRYKGTLAELKKRKILGGREYFED